MELYVIAGPNGAGKTTFAREFLPNYADCRNFVNADLIAQGMAPFAPETAALRARRLMLGEIRAFAKKGVSFGFETTLSGRSYVPIFRQVKARGYKIHLFFLWLKNVDLAISRVRDRVSRGGHDIPEPSLRSVDAKFPQVLSPGRGCVDAVRQFRQGPKGDRFGGEWESSYNQQDNLRGAG